jgi:PAS domain S-box-containing protein
VTAQDLHGETRFDELKRYVRFTAEDASRIHALLPIAQPHFERIAAQFYDRIREHEDAHAIFRDEEQITRLRRSLVKWLGRLLSGQYDEAYFQETTNIGHVHVRVGLPQRYMFTAMALIRVELYHLVDQHEDANLTRDSLSRLVDMELAIMLDAYRDDYNKRIERQLMMGASHAEREAHYFERAIELAGAMIVGLDPSGIIRLFNREAERVTGLARDEAIGTSFKEKLAFDDDADWKAVIAGSKEIARFDAPLTTRAGRTREIRWQLTHTNLHDGDPNRLLVAMLAVGIDITDEHDAIERAKQHEKLAAVGMLAAGLAHEIRNPLNGAQLHVAFLGRALRKANSGAELLDAVSVVDDEIKRLARLVTEFLDFARPRALDRKPTSIVALCKHVIELVRPQAEKMHVVAAPDLPTTDIELSLDRGKIEQVLLNLVQNAIEALEGQGGGHVTLRARRHPRTVVLEVEDDGPGLPSVDAPVFDAFYSTKPQGTGLGLAIALRIVSDHGGTIQVESKPGHTRFSVLLPWARTD